MIADEVEEEVDAFADDAVQSLSDPGDFEDEELLYQATQLLARAEDSIRASDGPDDEQEDHDDPLDDV